jgi:nitrogen fixation protein FixH
VIMEERQKRSRLWPGMIFGLIGLNFFVVGVTVYAASARRASFAVEPDYDRKALHWEESTRQAARNAELGWNISVERIGDGKLAVGLLDKAGKVIKGAGIEVEAFHHARAGKRLSVSLSQAADGNYEGDLAVDIPGLWDFRFTVRHEKETFTATLTRAIMGAGS